MIRIKSCALTEVDEQYLLEEMVLRFASCPAKTGLFRDALASLYSSEYTLGILEDHVLANVRTKESCHQFRSWLEAERDSMISSQLHDWTISEHEVHRSWEYIQKAQAHWERKVLRSLGAMCQELGLCFRAKRDKYTEENILQNWTELSLVFEDRSPIKPVFGSKDLLEVLICLRHPNRKNVPRIPGEVNPSLPHPYWGLFSVPIATKTWSDLRARYHTLALQNPQFGVDDQFSPQFVHKLETEASEILQNFSHARAKLYLQHGCPLSHRAKMWALYLNISVTVKDEIYYNNLKLSVAKEEYVADQLIIKEIQMTAENDEMHFVFCDFTYQVLLIFTRDTYVRDRLQPKLTSSQPSLRNTGEQWFYPPSRVIPFHGFSMYVLPLCYLYDDPVKLYIVFRQFYLKYFYKLHNINNEEDGLLSLCVLFEHLLQVREPRLFFHLRSYSIQPIRFAFKWLMRAFSGFLAPEQVLLLWDRILGFDSLELLAGEKMDVLVQWMSILTCRCLVCCSPCSWVKCLQRSSCHFLTRHDDLRLASDLDE